MIRKTTYILSGMIGIIVIAFALQPLRKEQGLDISQLDKSWPQLPASIQLGNPAGIEIDTCQHVVVLHRAGRKWPLLGPMPRDRIRQKTVFLY